LDVLEPGLLSAGAVAARRFVRSGFVRNTAGSLVTAAAAQAVLVVSGVFFARALGPENRGQLQLLILIPAIVAQVGSFGLPLALAFYVAQVPAHGRVLLLQLRGLVIGQCVAMMIVQGLVVTLILRGKSQELRWAGIATIVLPAASLTLEYGLSCLQGQQRFRAFNAIRFLTPLAQAIAAVLLFFYSRSVLTAVLVLLALTLAIAFLAWSRSLASTGRVATALPPSTRALVRFGLRAYVGSNYPVENFRIDQLLVAGMLAPAALGIYVVAYSFTNLPRFAAQSIGMVAYPRIAAGDRAGQRRAARIISGATALGLVPLGVLLVVAVRWLIPLMFGARFVPAIPVAQILIGASLIASCRRILAECLKGAGLPAAGSWAEFVAWPVLAVSMPILVHWGGLTGAASAVAISSAVSLGVLLLFDMLQGDSGHPHHAVAPT